MNPWIFSHAFFLCLNVYVFSREPNWISLVLGIICFVFLVYELKGTSHE